jgi:copper chaperone NosL
MYLTESKLTMKFFRLQTVISISFIALFFSSCSVEPVAIEYGKDACHFCKMNIVDSQHAAEIVTKKGKAFKYDAIECMMQNRFNWQEEEIALYLMTDYSNPGNLVDATKATYLISEGLPSPMGGNLSGFKNSADAEKTKTEKGGKVLTWEELKEVYSGE